MTASNAESVVERADDLEKSQKNNAGNDDFTKKLRLVSLFKFRDNDDIKSRFPFTDELRYDEEYDMYEWENRIVLPQSMVFDILEAEFGDLPSSIGVHKFFSYLKNRFVGISANQVSKYLRTSNEHQEYFTRKRSTKTQASVPMGPCHTVSIDIGYLESKDEEGRRKAIRYPYLIILVDGFTKMIRGRLLASREADVYVPALQEMLDEMPKKPKFIRSDNEFKGGVYSTFCSKNVLKPRYSLPATPEGNAKAEAAIKTVKTLLFSYFGGTASSRTRDDLRKDLQKVLRVHNNSQSSVTGYRPVDVEDPDCPKSVITKVKATLLEVAKGKNLNKKFNYELRAGDSVRIDRLALSNRLRQTRKQGAYKSSHNSAFSAILYTVASHSSDNMVRVKELPGRAFMRGQVLYVPDVEDRRKLVTEWAGERDSDGLPIGREDAFGFSERQRAVLSENH